ncbi:hypothetical protein SAMN05421743_10657 [Thalassobacillus cyri]|uniref:Uncharacterized protein n=1 Tax=Thalassobacillus cyri TaxID=571932 RepID=A0A1H4CHE6_9BACI|nr:hypothetical protein [Thalassobacillus cyri]SEA59774.1 hypothetical protein SAMN05421743_10657 [Thalassobacillus cyri]
MEIKSSKGVELVKDKSNSPEEFFNRSELVYEDKGREQKFSVLYLRYFDEKLHEFTPFTENPVMIFGDNEIMLKDLVAFIALVKNPGYKHRRKMYINEYEEYKELFSGVNWEAVKQAFLKINDGKGFDMESTLEFIHA